LLPLKSRTGFSNDFNGKGTEASAAIPKVLPLKYFSFPLYRSVSYIFMWISTQSGLQELAEENVLISPVGLGVQSDF